VRSNNDDSAGGLNGAPLSVNPGTCDYGSYFWGDNNVCQRNLSYAPVFELVETLIEFPFLIGNPFSPARLIEVIVHKAPALAELPMTLKVQSLDKKSKPPRADRERTHGARSLTASWKLTQAVGSVAFPVKPGQVHRATLTFRIPKKTKLHGRPTIEIFQRNDGGMIVGGVQLELVPARKRRPEKRRRKRPAK
jgi:hypothetical protein